MSAQDLRDKNGNRIGKLETQSSGEVVLRDHNGSRRGTYDPRMNVTRDHNGNLVGKGNLLVSLLSK